MVERCTFPNIHSNKNTYPGQASIVDVGGLFKSTYYTCQIAEYKFDIDAGHLRCLKMKAGKRGKHGNVVLGAWFLACWVVIAPFHADPGIIKVLIRRACSGPLAVFAAGMLFVH